MDAVLGRSFAHRTVIGLQIRQVPLRSVCVCVCVCVTLTCVRITTVYVSLCYYYTAHRLVIGLQIRQVSKKKNGGSCIRIVIGHQIRQV